MPSSTTNPYIGTVTPAGFVTFAADSSGLRERRDFSSRGSYRALQHLLACQSHGACCVVGLSAADVYESRYKALDDSVRDGAK
jgi:hypothetical protein